MRKRNKMKMTRKIKKIIFRKWILYPTKRSKPWIVNNNKLNINEQELCLNIENQIYTQGAMKGGAGRSLVMHGPGR